MLKNEDPPVPLAKVDATVETELAARFDVTGYPTLFLFKKGEKIPYEGPRTAMGEFSWGTSLELNFPHFLLYRTLWCFLIIR